jgi:(4-alkanoyl-5-oxo-2,5-dihydrofuran-3-yl)methyl phosphate reductase
MNCLITGATGNIGGRVVERLLARGERPRVYVRDIHKARSRFGDRVDVAVGDLADAAALARALAGIDVLFLVNSGPGLEVRDEAAANVARASGVKRLVKLSSFDAEVQVGTGVWHARGEAAIEALGIPFVFVRPTGFMDNALFWAHGIKTHGVVRSATGDGRIPFIHSDDIADVATRALDAPDLLGRRLPITGPEALSYADMTAKIAAAIGRPLRHEAASEADVSRFQAGLGEPPAMIEAHLSIYRAIREGRLATVTHEVERILGRPAIHFDRWVAQHARTLVS